MFSYDQNGRVWTRSGPRIHSGRSRIKTAEISAAEKIRFVFYNHVSVGVLSGVLFFKAFDMTKSSSDMQTGG